MPVTYQAPVHLTPITEQVRILAVEAGPGGGVRVSAVVTIDPENPLFAGHFPGLAVFPGVCQTECAHQTVLAAARPGGAVPVLEGFQSGRFLSMVSPGDEIGIETLITKAPERWTATAELRGARGLAAKVVLRYRLAGRIS